MKVWCSPGDRVEYTRMILVLGRELPGEFTTVEVPGSSSLKPQRRQRVLIFSVCIPLVMWPGGPGPMLLD